MHSIGANEAFAASTEDSPRPLLRIEGLIRSDAVHPHSKDT